MKRSATTAVLLAAAFALFASPALAQTYEYVPPDDDCYDLDHHKYYTWGIDVSELAGASIVEAELFFDNITNWNNNTDTLYIHLLDDAPLGITTVGDIDDGFEDAFEGQGVLIDKFSDENGSGTTEDLHYIFTDLGILGDLITYAQDGVIAVAMDPDCHYYNDEIKLIITVDNELVAEDHTWSRIKRWFDLF